MKVKANFGLTAALTAIVLGAFAAVAPGVGAAKCPVPGAGNGITAPTCEQLTTGQISTLPTNPNAIVLHMKETLPEMAAAGVKWQRYWSYELPQYARNYDTGLTKHEEVLMADAAKAPSPELFVLLFESETQDQTGNASPAYIAWRNQWVAPDKQAVMDAKMKSEPQYWKTHGGAFYVLEKLGILKVKNEANGQIAVRFYEWFRGKYPNDTLTVDRLDNSTFFVQRTPGGTWQITGEVQGYYANVPSHG